MDLNKSSWHVKLFFFALAVTDEFFDRGDTSYQFENGTNLCHFVRTICLYLPLIILAHLGILGIVFYVVAGLPINLFGLGSYLVVMATAISVLLATMIIKRIRRFLKKPYDADGADRNWMEQEKRRREKTCRAKVKATPSFGQIIWSYLVAVKKHFCPQLKFR